MLFVLCTFAIILIISIVSDNKNSNIKGRSRYDK